MLNVCDCECVLIFFDLSGKLLVVGLTVSHTGLTSVEWRAAPRNFPQSPHSIDSDPKQVEHTVLYSSA